MGKVNWRPIKSAPLDQQVLLSYENNGDTYVNQGRWVNVPHTNTAMNAVLKHQPVSDIPADGHWCIAYIAIMQHGGRQNFHSFEERAYRIYPSHWQPLPHPSKATSTQRKGAKP